MNPRACVTSDQKVERMGSKYKAAPAPLARCDPGPNPYREGLFMDTIRSSAGEGKQARRITAKPTAYEGITYRSALEADWAAMFTTLGIYFEYEPEAYSLPSGGHYLADFYLPSIKTYCEAKGPHDERLYKPQEFAAVLTATECAPQEFQVVVLRAAGPSGAAAWEWIDDNKPIMLGHCTSCQHWGFTAFDSLWQQHWCRRCYSSYFLDDIRRSESPDSTYGAGRYSTIPMTRVPRVAA